MRWKCRAFLLVGDIGHGGRKFSLIAKWFRCLSHFQTVGKSFHLSQTGPGVVHIFNSMFHAPSSHRTAYFHKKKRGGNAGLIFWQELLVTVGESFHLSETSQGVFQFSISLFKPPHRITPHHTEILVTVDECFHSSHTGPGVFHIFDSMFYAPSSHRTGKCRAYLLVGVIGHGGLKFSLIANWSRCHSIFNSIFMPPHCITLRYWSRWAKVSTYRILVQVSFTFSIPWFMPPHRIALESYH